MNRFLPFVLALAFLLPALALAETGAPPTPAASCGAPALFSAPAPNVTPNAPVEPVQGTVDLGDAFNPGLTRPAASAARLWPSCVGARQGDPLAAPPRYSILRTAGS